MSRYDPFNWFWVVGDDENRAYSSAAAGYVDVSEADPQRITHIRTEAALVAVLRDADVPPYHRVAKSTIIARLTDQQLAAAAQAFGNPENLRLRERWYAPDQPAINANDPESVGFVKMIGADPAVVLAPERPRDISSQVKVD